MNTLTFDTLKVAKQLQELGFSDRQAEGLSSLLNTAVVGDLATKEDINVLRKELKATETVLRAEIKATEDRLMAEIARVQDRLTIRMGGIVIAGVAFLKALDYLI